MMALAIYDATDPLECRAKSQPHIKLLAMGYTGNRRFVYRQRRADRTPILNPRSTPSRRFGQTGRNLDSRKTQSYYLSPERASPLYRAQVPGQTLRER